MLLPPPTHPPLRPDAGLHSVQGGSQTTGWRGACRPGQSEEWVTAPGSLSATPGDCRDAAEFSLPPAPWTARLGVGLGRGEAEMGI